MSAGDRAAANRAGSERAFAAAKRVIPGGVNSTVRAFKAVGGTPVFVREAQGAYLTDVDGNRYLDYVLSWGPMILGHAHPAVVAAIRDAAGRGTSYGTPTEYETELARADRRRGALGREGPLLLVGDRGHRQRDPPGARLHRAREVRQVRRLLPRLGRRRS